MMDRKLNNGKTAKFLYHSDFDYPIFEVDGHKITIVDGGTYTVSSYDEPCMPVKHEYQIVDAAKYNFFEGKFDE